MRANRRFKGQLAALLLCIVFRPPVHSFSTTYWVENLVYPENWGENIELYAQGADGYDILKIDPRSHSVDEVKKASPELQKKLPSLLDAKTHVFLNRGKSNVLRNGMSAVSEQLSQELSSSVNIPVSILESYFDALYATGGNYFQHDVYEPYRRIFIQSESRSGGSASVYFGDEAHEELSGQLQLGTLMTYLPLPQLPQAALEDESVAWACVVDTFDQDQTFDELHGSDSSMQKSSVWGLPAYIRKTDLLGPDTKALDSIGRDSSPREDLCPYCGERLSKSEVANLTCNSCKSRFKLAELSSYQSAVRRAQEEQEAFRRAAQTPDASNVVGRWFVVHIDLTDWVIPSKTKWKSHTQLTFSVLCSSKSIGQGENLFSSFTGAAVLNPAEIIVVDSWVEGVKANIVDVQHAKSEAGEDEGVDFSSVIVEGLAAGAAAVGGAAAAAGAAGAAGGIAGADGQPLDDEERKKKYYKMRIKKDFDDTLKSCDEPRYVYARITEVDSQTGVETNRPDLTAAIQVSSPDASLVVQDGGMSSDGIYKAAVVCATEELKEGSEGTVSFQYTGEGGSFTRHLIFKIDGPKIRFAQESIALEAGSDEGVALPFEVEGFSKGTFQLDVAMSNGSSYTVSYIPSKEVPDFVFFAVLGDINEDLGEPGT
ncbi:MAG: hypothetical protein J6Y13_07625 [Treponema sp.]|nr:hypothetical protein [Treponema sp.]